MDQLIIFGIMGFASAYVVSAVMRLVVIFMQFSTSISEVFLPRITHMVSAKASGDDLTDLMIPRWTNTVFDIGTDTYGLSSVRAKSSSKLAWNQDAYTDTQMLNMYYIGCIILVPLTLPLIQNTGISMLVAKNKHHFRSTVYFIIAVLNIGLTIWFVKLFGIVGASVATAIALTLGNA